MYRTRVLVLDGGPGRTRTERTRRPQELVCPLRTGLVGVVKEIPVSTRESRRRWHYLSVKGPSPDQRFLYLPRHRCLRLGEVRLTRESNVVKSLRHQSGPQPTCVKTTVTTSTQHNTTQHNVTSTQLLTQTKTTAGRYDPTSFICTESVKGPKVTGQNGNPPNKQSSSNDRPLKIRERVQWYNGFVDRFCGFLDSVTTNTLSFMWEYFSTH